MSTSALIGLSPIARRRFCIHSGDGPLRTPRTSRSAKAGQRLASAEAKSRCTRVGQSKRAADRFRRRRPEGSEPRRREVAGDAGDAGRVGPVRRQRHVDHRIVKPGPTRVRDADRRVVGQLHDAVVIVAELELRRRAQHAVRLDAADDALGEGDLLPGNIGPDRREHALHSRAGVRRAADHLDRPGAGVDHADLQPVGVGMLHSFDHPRDDEAVVFGARVFDAFHLEADAGQRFDDLGERGRGVEMVPEPGEREFHRVVPPMRVASPGEAPTPDQFRPQRLRRSIRPRASGCREV